MYTKRNYGFLMTLNWSKTPFIVGLIYSGIIAFLARYFNITLAFPWQPVSVIGIAVAFYLGFKNNSSYDRTWEARKIWGTIVNLSRSFAISTTSFVQGQGAEAIQKELIYRHIAWLTALRHQLRLSREWEHTEDRIKGMYNPVMCEDYDNKLGEELKLLIADKELEKINGSSNLATQILNIQAIRLQELKDLGFFEDFRHMEFHHILMGLYDSQGASERIKNFPFPRQYASTALWLTMVFCALIPFAMLDVFNATDNLFLIVASPLISALLFWIYFLMEKIGDYSENPFEGTYNDVPITSISRGIEIDMREMIKDDNIPTAFEANNGFLL